MAQRSNGRNNNKMTRTSSKIEPAIHEMYFTATPVGVAGAGPGAPGTSSTFYIDLNQCNSLVNRRFYRQGLLNAVNGIKLVSTSVLAGTLTPVLNAPTGKILVEKLPSTWVMSNAWEKSFRVWQRMNNEALAETESIRPRFLDFKVYADSTHHNLGFGANLLPANATAGEWESSKIAIPIATDLVPAAGGATMTELEVIATGASYPGAGASGLDAVSAIEGYASSRALPALVDPNVPGDASDTVGLTPENWMTAIFNEGETQSHEIIVDLISENNIAPYPFEGDGVAVDTMYPGGANQQPGLQVHDLDRITGTTIGGITRINGGAFPCGLIKVTITNYDEVYELFPKLLISLAPGPHRGLLAVPMTEM